MWWCTWVWPAYSSSLLARLHFICLHINWPHTYISYHSVSIKTCLTNYTKSIPLFCSPKHQKLDLSSNFSKDRRHNAYIFKLLHFFPIKKEKRSMLHIFYSYFQEKYRNLTGYMHLWYYFYALSPSEKILKSRNNTSSLLCNLISLMMKNKSHLKTCIISSVHNPKRGNSGSWKNDGYEVQRSGLNAFSCHLSWDVGSDDTDSLINSILIHKIRNYEERKPLHLFCLTVRRKGRIINDQPQYIPVCCVCFV